MAVEGDEDRRVWLPLYRQLLRVDAGNRARVGVRDGRLLSGAELEALGEVTGAAVPPGELRVLSLRGAAAGGPAVPGSLQVALGAPGGARVCATLDAAVVSERLAFDPGAATGGEAHSHPYPLALLVAGDGSSHLYAAPDGPDAARARAALEGLLPDLAGKLAAGSAGTVCPPEVADGPCVAYTPIVLDHGPYGQPEAVGGALASSLPHPGGGGDALQRLTRSTQLRLALLTLLATASVALAGYLVSRRMARPWVLLGDRAAAAAELPETQPSDAVDLISRSVESLASRAAAGEGRARVSEGRLLEFIDMNPDGIAVTGADGRIAHFNSTLCRMLRRTPTELVGQPLALLCADPADWEGVVARLEEKGRLRNLEFEIARGDGSRFPGLVSLRLSSQGEPGCVDAIVRDVSEQVEARRRDREKTAALFQVYGELSHAHEALRDAYGQVEEEVRAKTGELQTACEALRAANEVKSEFLMRMSHELRTPLNCIIGYSEAMGEGLDGPVNPDQTSSLQRISESGRRLLRLIENLLDLSQLEAGRMGFHCTTVRIEEAVADVVHQSRGLLRDRPVDLVTALPDPLPPVWADADRVRQVLFNLVGNALKFTDAGTVSIQVHRPHASFVEVRVSDTGPGVAPEHQETVFEKFIQAGGARRGGAGLGLAICREIVERMGGHIRLESILGAGSTFAFTLPVEGAQAQLPLPLGPPVAAAPRRTAPPQPPSGAPEVDQQLERPHQGPQDPAPPGDGLQFPARN